MRKVVKCLAFVLTMVVMLIALSACVCPSSEPNKAREQLFRKGYEVRDVDFSPFVDDGKTDAAIIAVKYGSGYDIITAAEKIIIYYLKTKEYADEVERALLSEEEQGAVKQKYNELGKDYDIIVGRSGNIVWTGTKQAVKDAR